MNKILAIAGRLYPILPILLWSGLFKLRPSNAVSCASKYRTIYGACFLMCLASTSTLARADVADTLTSIKPGIVGVGSFNPSRSPRVNMMGTGFVVGDGKYVVSCSHIFTGILDSEKKETWAVLTGRDRQMVVRNATIVSRDKERDLILLRIDGDPLPPLKLAQSDTVREGWQLYFTGYPIGSVLGLNPSTHRAGLAAVVPIYTPVPAAFQLNARTLQQAKAQYEIYELDAIAYPGNSGSPVWHPETGEVVGVVNSVFVKGAKETAITAPSGITYAIPVRWVRELMREAAPKP